LREEKRYSGSAGYHQIPNTDAKKSTKPAISWLDWRIHEQKSVSWNLALVVPYALTTYRDLVCTASIYWSLSEDYLFDSSHNSQSSLQCASVFSQLANASC
ncbi:MAG: hypothetical protein QGF90_09075, partial [Gammaproteobacteria bacterium]|nr:hypothetical protein [Gammaproteobacteria bacterium]